MSEGKKSPKSESSRFPLRKEVQQLQLGDIEVFVTIARLTCTNEKAGEKVGKSPSEITRSREALDNAFGKVLSYHKITAEGETLLSFAEQISDATHGAVDSLEKTSLANPPSIRIGYLQTPVHLFYSEACRIFNKKYSTEIAVETPWGHECIKKVRVGDLELALLARPDPPMKLSKKLRYRELVQYRMFCAVGTRAPHPFKGKKSVSLAEMRRHCILMMSKEAKLYTAHVRMFFKKVGGLKRIRHCPDAGTQIDKLLSGEGIALVMFPFRDFVKGKDIEMIPVEPAEYLGVGALFKPRVHNAVAEFVEIAEKVIKPQLRKYSRYSRPPDESYLCRVETLGGSREKVEHSKRP